MDVNALISFGIPTGAVGYWLWRRYGRPYFAPELVKARIAKSVGLPSLPAPSPGKAEAMDESADEGPEISFRELLRLVNELSDQNVHVAWVGKTGSSKTTHATAFIACRQGRVVVLTHKTDDWWGGLPFIAIDDTEPTFDEVLADLVREADRRKALLDVRVYGRDGSARNREALEELTIVLDDYTELWKGSRERRERLKALVQRILRLGRSGRIRIMLIADSLLLKSIDMEGEGDIRKHFLTVELDQQRVARVWWQDEWLTADTEGVWQIAQRRMSSGRAWAGPSIKETGLIAERVFNDFSTLKAVDPIPVSAGIPDMNAENAGISQIAKNIAGLPRDLRVELLVELGVSANAIANAVGGDRNAVLERIRALRPTTTTEPS